MPIKFFSYLGLFPEDRFPGPELPSDQLYVNGMAFLDSLRGEAVLPNHKTPAMMPQFQEHISLGGLMLWMVWSYPQPGSKSVPCSCEPGASQC